MKFTKLCALYGSRQKLWLHLFNYHEEGFLTWKNPRAARVKIGDVAGRLNIRYVTVMAGSRTQFVHRIVYEMFNGDTESEVDHIDTNALNNKLENLRPATRAENTRNVGARRDNALGIKGVSYNKASGKYIAQTTVAGKRKWLGAFSTPEAASAAYQAAAKELHGEFANAS